MCLAWAATARAGEPWPRPAAGVSRSGGPELILTFDDGPDETTTPVILDELARRNLKAVFFWVGHRVTGARSGVGVRREVARRAVREGHLVGNHTIHHAQLCAGPREQAEWEIDENARIYASLIGMPLRWFRAPYGARCDRLKLMLAERGVTHFHWDMDPHEWEHKDDAVTLEYVQRKLRSLDGRGVLLLHDTKRVTTRVLPVLLDWIDDENARRLAAGRRPIRIVSYVELAREQLAPGFEDWLRDTGAGVAAVAERFTGLVPGEATGHALGRAW
jgi:peptidoglycan/xylan/chitin deacetylase (PgdA/CDA1 family)